MQQATLTMSDDATINVFFKDGDDIDFQAILDAKGVEDIHVVDTMDHEEMERCRIGLRCGDFIFCWLHPADISVLSRLSEEIIWCAKDDTLDRVNTAAREDELNIRLNATCSLILNHPDNELKDRMLGEYIKRKSAYISSLEALVSGMTNE